MTKNQELVVITKTYDLILWSCHHTGTFPRNHRFVLDERLERNLYDLLETLLRAKYTRQRQPVLEQAKEDRLGQHVTLHSRVLGRSAKRWHMIHFMTIDEPDMLAATAEVVSTYLDMTVRRSAVMPAVITDAIDRLLTEHASLGWDAPVCGAMKP